jgi:DNA polymerase-3 subunit alpha
MNAPDFHVHSTFSTLDGMGTPLAVVERAKKLGWGAVCLTEHGWMGSAPVLYKAARENGLNPIIGCEFYVVPNEILGVKSKDTRSGSFHLTVLALSAEGYHNLVAWTTYAAQPENFYYRPRISLDAMVNIAPHPLHHNVVLSGCLGSEICSALAAVNGNGINPEPFIGYIESMKSLFPNFYIELQNHRHEKFMDKEYLGYETMVKTEAIVRRRLISLARQTNTPTILTNDSHFQTTQQRTAHLLMTSQKRGHGGRVEASDYMGEYGYFTNYMQSMEKVAERTTDLPGDSLANAIAIAEEADIRLSPLDDFTYSIPSSGYSDPLDKIRRRSSKRLAALRKRHGAEEVDARFEMELETMGGFANYLLIMSDFIIHARKQGILTNTRGSAANSLICYCLRIHDIDPMPGAYDLLFSRFVNPARKKLPDIDIDIQRESVP